MQGQSQNDTEGHDLSSVAWGDLSGRLRNYIGKFTGRFADISLPSSYVLRVFRATLQDMNNTEVWDDRSGNQRFEEHV